MKNHLNSWREKFVHALFRHTCTLIAFRNGEEKKQDVLQDVKLKQIFTLTKTVTILFVHERGNSVHASRGYAARSVPEFPRSWTNNIVTITSCLKTTSLESQVEQICSGATFKLRLFDTRNWKVLYAKVSDTYAFNEHSSFFKFLIILFISFILFVYQFKIVYNSVIKTVFSRKIFKKPTKSVERKFSAHLGSSECFLLSVILYMRRVYATSHL